MAINGQAWKITHEKNSNRCVYRMQVTGVKGARVRGQVEKAMAGWDSAGDGYNARTQEETLFFSKDFGDVKNFIAWGKSFQEFPLVELDKDGEIKKYVKIGPRGDRKGGSRQCGKCGGYGHNARTCGTTRTVKAASTGTRKCGKCQQTGHNARTCKNGFSAAKATEIFKKKGSLPSVASKGKYKCGKCGKVGHNARRCSK